jgi:hypothetical protein
MVCGLNGKKTTKQENPTSPKSRHTKTIHVERAQGYTAFLALNEKLAWDTTDHASMYQHIQQIAQVGFFVAQHYRSRPHFRAGLFVYRVQRNTTRRRRGVEAK